MSSSKNSGNSSDSSSLKGLKKMVSNVPRCSRGRSKKAKSNARVGHIDLFAIDEVEFELPKAQEIPMLKSLDQRQAEEREMERETFRARERKLLEELRTAKSMICYLQSKVKKLERDTSDLKELNERSDRLWMINMKHQEHMIMCAKNYTLFLQQKPQLASAPAPEVQLSAGRSIPFGAELDVDESQSLTELERISRLSSQQPVQLATAKVAVAGPPVCAQPGVELFGDSAQPVPVQAQSVQPPVQPSEVLSPLPAVQAQPVFVLPPATAVSSLTREPSKQADAVTQESNDQTVVMDPLFPDLKVDSRAWTPEFQNFVLRPTKNYSYGSEGDKKFIKDAAMVLWDAEKLRTHSLSGKISNATLKRNPNAAPPGPPLPLHEVRAVQKALERRVRIERSQPLPPYTEEDAKPVSVRTKLSTVKFQIGQRRHALLRVKNPK